MSANGRQDVSVETLEVASRVDDRSTAAGSFPDVEDYDVIAQELSGLGEKIRSLEDRVAEVERVNARLEDAALTTARALGEVSLHRNAVYDAMRRPETIDPATSSNRDHAASSARHDREAVPPRPDH